MKNFLLIAIAALSLTSCSVLVDVFPSKKHDKGTKETKVERTIDVDVQKTEKK